MAATCSYQVYGTLFLFVQEYLKDAKRPCEVIMAEGQREREREREREDGREIGSDSVCVWGGGGGGEGGDGESIECT